MKICLMAAASAMLLAGCSTKDNAAGTTVVETTAKIEDTKETEKTDKTTQAAVSETTEAAVEMVFMTDLLSIALSVVL